MYVPKCICLELRSFIVATIPTEIGWRAAFAIGALIALGTLLIRRHIPESPRWLLEQGDTATASKIINSIEQGQVLNIKVKPKKNMKGKKGSNKFVPQIKELFLHYPGRVALGCLLDFSEAAGYYGLLAFLPIFILPNINMEATFIPIFYLIGSFGSLIGGIVVALLLDRIGRKITVPLFYTLAAGSVFLIAGATTTGSWEMVLIAFVVANLFATGSWMSAYPTFSEIFPTSLRSTGIGISVAFGRVGALVAPLIMAYVATAYGITEALIVLAGFWLLGTVTMIPWIIKGVEGKGKSLEELSQPVKTYRGQAENIT